MKSLKNNIYQTADGGTGIDVRLEDETVWLTQAQMAKLYISFEKFFFVFWNPC